MVEGEERNAQHPARFEPMIPLLRDLCSTVAQRHLALGYSSSGARLANSIFFFIKVLSLRGSTLASHPAAPGSIPPVPRKFSEEKLSMLLRLINGTG